MANQNENNYQGRQNNPEENIQAKAGQKDQLNKKNATGSDVDNRSPDKKNAGGGNLSDQE